jgi:hypothetical protein
VTAASCYRLTASGRVGRWLTKHRKRRLDLDGRLKRRWGAACQQRYREGAAGGRPSPWRRTRPPLYRPAAVWSRHRRSASGGSGADPFTTPTTLSRLPALAHRYGARP